MAAGEFGEVAFGVGAQLEGVERVFDDGFIVFRRPALVVGVAAEHEQIAHADAADDVVVLGEDGEDFGQLGGGGGGYVVSADADAAVFERLQAGGEGQEGGFARPVGADEGGDAAFGQIEADVVEDGLRADAVADVADLYHGWGSLGGWSDGGGRLKSRTAGCNRFLAAPKLRFQTACCVVEAV